MQSTLGGAGFPARCADAATGRLAGSLNRTGNCFLKNAMMETLALSAPIFCSTDGSSFILSSFYPRTAPDRIYRSDENLSIRYM